MKKGQVREIHFCFYVIEPNVIIVRKDLNFHPVLLKKLNNFLTAVKYEEIPGRVDMGRERTQGGRQVSLPYSHREAEIRLFFPYV